MKPRLRQPGPSRLLLGSLACVWPGTLPAMVGALAKYCSACHGENSPKGGRERTIPLSESALAVLKELKDARRLLPEVPISDDVRPYVFGNPDGSRLSYAQVAKVLPNACRRAGLAKRYTWHSLRHAFASHLLQRGAGELVLMKLLGHQDLKMVQIYAKPAESNLRAAVQLLDGGAT